MVGLFVKKRPKHTNGHDKSNSHRANMQINCSHNAKKIISQLKKYLGVRTDIELSKLMEVSPSTISTWKKRNSLDYSLVLNLCKVHNIDLNLLFFGTKHEESFKISGKSPLISKESLHEYIIGGFKNRIAELPHYCLPFTQGKEYRVFQVISNDVAPVLAENDFAICERVEIHNLSPQDLTVIVSRKKGFFVSYLTKKGDSLILLNHINPYVPHPFQIKIAYVDETWIVRGKISFDLQNRPFPSYSEIENFVSSSGH